MKKINLILSSGMGGGGGIFQMAAGATKSAFGVGQIIAGAVNNKKAEGMTPQEVDPSVSGMVDVFRRLRKGYTTGSEASAYKNTVNQGLATNANKIASLAGGNTSAAVSALSNAQVSSGEAYGNIAASLEKNRLVAAQAESQGVNDIAQRRLDIQMMKYLQKKAQAMSEVKAGQQNWMAGMDEFAGGADSYFSGGAAGGKKGGGGQSGTTIAGGMVF
jgi:hypothetical protein